MIFTNLYNIVCIYIILYIYINCYYTNTIRSKISLCMLHTVCISIIKEIIYQVGNIIVIVLVSSQFLGGFTKLIYSEFMT